MANARNSRTTHPSKAARRKGALERFSLNGLLMKTSAGYSGRKLTEFLALGGISADFSDVRIK